MVSSSSVSTPPLFGSMSITRNPSTFAPTPPAQPSGGASCVGCLPGELHVCKPHPHFPVSLSNGCMPTFFNFIPPPPIS